jgi:hypothetical protein
MRAYVRRGIGEAKVVELGEAGGSLNPGSFDVLAAGGIADGVERTKIVACDQGV